ncbi:MAG: hypothetical protein SGI77_27175 [Pirellulaceae bacterium]|nr:hypothetical protein [Pirellulaceae bacterium]
MKIKVAIPHFLGKEKKEKHDFNLPADWVPGSARGNIEKRERSFQRCLWSLVHSAMLNQYVVHDLLGDRFVRIEEPIQQHEISIRVTIDGYNISERVLGLYRDYIEVHEVRLEDSRNLVFEAREDLLDSTDCDYDLFVYCEDDIGFSPPNFFERIAWFAECSKQLGVLMPHRFENPELPDIERAYIDGSIYRGLLDKFQTLELNALELKYGDQSIVFDKPTNPHSAMFCVTKAQRDLVVSKGVQRRNDLVREFESVATLTVLEFFDVYKTDWRNRNFLQVEHLFTNYC